ncbi:spore morphogenesis/germination protein YwcE [Pontibacillus salicampi]|uniref:Spore morphogenesis/germination protein YwcE n=1 Tax=Pontibacillus salicampi TaxID=1449801 RepID=A0ABV6LIN3_9BACI
MDVLLVYVIFATITPLFLWLEHRTTALIQLPLIVGMWAYFIVEFASLSVTGLAYTSLLILFMLNIVYAHYAFYIVFFQQEQTRNRIFDKMPFITKRIS